MIALKDNNIADDLGTLRQMKDWYENIQSPTEEYPCAANWNKFGQTESYNKKFIVVQLHKCMETYCLRRRKCTNGEECGEPVCRF